MPAEGSNQRGFIYERNAYTSLKKYGIVTGSAPAGAVNTIPDIEIQRGKTKTGCELKLAPTAAGSLVMKYMNGEWSFGETDGDPEKELLKFVGEKYNLLRNHMNNKSTRWGKSTPILQNDPSNPKNKIVGKQKFSQYPVPEKKAFYDSDIRKYGGQNEVKLIVPATFICDYYIAKGCSYLNVGTHGLYTLNNRDDLGLNKQLAKAKKQLIPDFAISVTAEIRVRCQLKSMSKADYQFVMTLQFKGVRASQYNLAPTMSKDNVAINTKVLTNKENMPLIEAFTS
jgi:hypothetical protein